MAESGTPGWVKFTAVERAMARRMERTVQVPLATEFTHVDTVLALGEIKRLRAEGVPATFSAVVLAAVARGLARFPAVAAEVDYEAWTRHIPEEPNVGIAMAAERGLLVPVLRKVTRKTPLELVHELDQLVKAIRAGSTDPSHFAGGHLSITNIGSQPIYGGTPLPNSPQIAIVGVSSIWEAPVVKNGEIVISRQARFTIALDHRALDGATAAGFLVHLKELVEDPVSLMASSAAADTVPHEASEQPRR
jgi:pyruvate dehydrogenase E2 component (dihydrolipoamide acetyltransferase)